MVWGANAKMEWGERWVNEKTSKNSLKK